jgi:hypothetical protein
MVEAEIQEQLARVRGDLPFRQDRAAQVVRERFGGDLEGIGRDHGLRQPRPQGAGIAVGAQDDALGRELGPLRGGDGPARSAAGQAGDRAVPVDGGAGLQRGAGEAAGIAERLDRAAAAVQPATHVPLRPEEPRGLGAVEDPGRRAEAGPLFRPTRDLGEPGFGMGALDPAGAPVRHVHVVPGDQVEDRIGGAAGKAREPLAALAPELGDEVGGIVFQPRDHLTAVAPGPAEADLAGLQHHRPDPALGQVQGGREAAEAAADDHDVGLPGFGQGRRLRPGGRGGGPERRREGKRFGHGDS